MTSRLLLVLLLSCVALSATHAAAETTQRLFPVALYIDDGRMPLLGGVNPEVRQENAFRVAKGVFGHHHKIYTAVLDEVSVKGKVGQFEEGGKFEFILVSFDDRSEMRALFLLDPVGSLKKSYMDGVLSD